MISINSKMKVRREIFTYLESLLASLPQIRQDLNHLLPFRRQGFPHRQRVICNIKDCRRALTHFDAESNKACTARSEGPLTFDHLTLTRE
jgi:hypothetical protein